MFSSELDQDVHKLSTNIRIFSINSLLAHLSSFDRDGDKIFHRRIGRDGATYPKLVRLTYFWHFCLIRFAMQTARLFDKKLYLYPHMQGEKIREVGDTDCTKVHNAIGNVKVNEDATETILSVSVFPKPRSVYRRDSTPNSVKASLGVAIEMWEPTTARAGERHSRVTAFVWRGSGTHPRHPTRHPTDGGAGTPSLCSLCEGLAYSGYDWARSLLRYTRSVVFAEPRFRWYNFFSLSVYLTAFGSSCFFFFFASFRLHSRASFVYYLIDSVIIIMLYSTRKNFSSLSFTLKGRPARLGRKFTSYELSRCSVEVNERRTRGFDIRELSTPWRGLT